jgi:thiol-disulfide isomerase/thioredoxin
VEQRLCSEQAINSYPNIRLYPSFSQGLSRFEQYQGWMRDSNSLLQWAVNFMPSKAHMLDMNNFEAAILKNHKPNAEDVYAEPWLVDFYAPWCGYCQVFSPTFETLASKFDGKIRFGKVNCQEHQYLCQITGINAYPTIRFYPLTSPNEPVNWMSGENIELYEINAITNELNKKLEFYGLSEQYRRSLAAKDKKATGKIEEKTEL